MQSNISYMKRICLIESENYHLFEYAELYDEVHHRLYRTSYYGQKKFDEKVRIYKPKQLESRRKEIGLPDSRFL